MVLRRHRDIHDAVHRKRRLVEGMFILRHICPSCLSLTRTQSKLKRGWWMCRKCNELFVPPVRRLFLSELDMI
jgi:ribosomal protein L37AE/L43A